MALRRRGGNGVAKSESFKRQTKIARKRRETASIISMKNIGIGK
jgi:hypothetical protein